ncbi:MAG: prolyl aminopeptidase [Cycloclasticus sp. symbiont of Poecilosclerida sp. N]|nr:MAG: prolyl aminopeptidase [Cycloclasticus sp. symbiont of Poecilosclerida sp. N]
MSFKTLYPNIDPFAHEWLETGDGHDVYFEQVGNPNGVPVIFLHGGPGSSCKDHHRCFFNPEKYHIILMDQRGAGRSKPLGGLKNNTTQHLLQDMEAIRQKLNIEKWLLFGGSWGATLALLYAQKYVQRTLGLILRGTFLARSSDVDWFLKEGVSRLFPEAWQRFINHMPTAEHKNLLATYHQHLNSDDSTVRKEAAREWDAWGGAVVLGDDFNANELDGNVPEAAIAQARIETHYAMNNYFIDENKILSNTACLLKLPCTIIHGRKDFICPIESSFTLAQVLPKAQFITLANSTHLAHGDEMIDALVGAADDFLETL